MAVWKEVSKEVSNRQSWQTVPLPGGQGQHWRGVPLTANTLAVWQERQFVTEVFLLHNLNLTTRKNLRQPQIEGWTPQNCHGFENKGTLTDCHNEKDLKTRQLEVMWVPGQDPRTQNVRGNQGNPNQAWSWVHSHIPTLVSELSSMDHSNIRDYHWGKLRQGQTGTPCTIFTTFP